MDWRLPERCRALAPATGRWVPGQSPGRRRVGGEWAARQRRAEQAVPSGTGRSPSARKIARLLTVGRDRLCRADAIQVARIEAALPALAAARLLTDRFTDMVRNACEGELAAWLDAAKDSMIASFARGFRRDYAAVAAALRELWSNGQTEGQINRLKTLRNTRCTAARTSICSGRASSQHHNHQSASTLSQSHNCMPVHKRR